MCDEPGFGSVVTTGIFNTAPAEMMLASFNPLACISASSETPFACAILKSESPAWMVY